MTVNQKREAYIHDRIFGTLGRPLSRMADENDMGMGIFDDIKVTWNHFGRKYKFHFKKDELSYIDVFDNLMRKISIERPDFEGSIAYHDKHGRQIVITNDVEMRHALKENNNKLKIYTTVQNDKGYIAAADLIKRPQRSYSVPADYHSRFSNGSSQVSPVSSNSQNSPYYGNQQPRLSKSPEINENLNVNVNSNHSPQSHGYSHHTPNVQSPRSSYDSNGGRVAVYNNNGSVIPYPQDIPPGYAYTVTSVAPYNSHLMNGYPPHNWLLNHFLTAPHMPYMTRGTFTGPNKYHNWHSHRYYYKVGAGPIW
uniref:PB1 domain-containing protein n=1 Tax=Strongyloides venezuelensis TaxID=75913 RepID=A0A0K0FXD4_STRVS